MSTKGKVIVSYVILAIVIIGLVVFASNRHEKLKATEAREAQNIVALTDTVTYYENKNGEIVATKAAMQMTLDQLKIANDSLANIIANHKDSVIVVTRIVTETIYDTIIVYEGIVEGDSDQISISFAYEQPQINFNSSTLFNVDQPVNISNTSLVVTGLTINAGITTAIVEDEEGIKRIEVISDNPNLTFTSIDGNIVPDEQVGFRDKFGVGVAVGPTVNYDLIDTDFSVGIGITAGLVYKRVNR